MGTRSHRLSLQFAAAERHFRAALEKQLNAQTYTGLGIVLWRQGRVDEGIASLQDAIEADPRHPAAYDQLGTILVEEGRFAESESNYRALVRTQPSAAAHQKMADVLMRLGRTDEARKEMEMAQALDRNAEARYGIESLIRPGEAVALDSADHRDGWITVARSSQGKRLGDPIRDRAR